ENILRRSDCSPRKENDRPVLAGRRLSTKTFAFRSRSIVDLVYRSSRQISAGARPMLARSTTIYRERDLEANSSRRPAKLSRRAVPARALPVLDLSFRDRH